MMSYKHWLVLGFSCAVTAAAAISATLSTLALSDNDLQNFAQRESRKGDLGSGPDLSSETRAALKAMSQEQRVKAVHEVVAAVKPIVMSPQFLSSYNSYIFSSFDAKNYNQPAGAPNPQDPEAMASASQKQVMAALNQSMQMMPIEMIKMLIDQDLPKWTARASGQGSDRAKYQKLVQLATQLKASNNVDEVRKGFITLKLTESGNDTALGSDEANKAKRAQQQKNYDQYNLKSALKRKLAEFVALARSVDFDAQTKGQGYARKFVNLEYERKSYGWKNLYRFGKAPTMAAVEEAEKWISEL